MSDTILAALVTGFFSLVSALVTLLLAKDEGFFWRHKKIIRFSGEAIILKRFSREGLGEPHEQLGNPSYTQKLHNGELLIAGRSVKMFTDIIINDGQGRSVSGKLTAKGHIHNDKAFMTYEICDKGKGQDWCGVMMVYITGFGNIEAHFLTESFKKPGYANFGRMCLSRR